MATSNATLTDSHLALPVKHLIKRAPLFVDASVSVKQAAQVMQEARVGAMLIAGEPPGIVTDRDLRGRVLAAGLGPDTPVTLVCPTRLSPSTPPRRYSPPCVSCSMKISIIYRWLKKER